LICGLGRAECSHWAERMIGAAGNVPAHIQSLLHHIYILYSGNPRALSVMKKRFEDGSIDAEVIDKLKLREPLNDLLFDHLLSVLKVDRYTPNLTDSMTPHAMETFVFSAPATFSTENEKFRKLLEKGTIFIQGQTRTDDPEFTVAVPALSLLSLIKDSTIDRVPPDCPCTRAAVLLLGGLVREKKLRNLVGTLCRSNRCRKIVSCEHLLTRHLRFIVMGGRGSSTKRYI
jgi:hypothetical protein